MTASSPTTHQQQHQYLAGEYDRSRTPQSPDGRAGNRLGIGDAGEERQNRPQMLDVLLPPPVGGIDRQQDDVAGPGSCEHAVADVGVRGEKATDTRQRHAYPQPFGPGTCRAHPYQFAVVDEGTAWVVSTRVGVDGGRRANEGGVTDPK